MFQVWIINSRGVYEKVAEFDNAKQAALLKNGLTRRGTFTQICKAGEMAINGGKR